MRRMQEPRNICLMLLEIVRGSVEKRGEVIKSNPKPCVIIFQFPKKRIAGAVECSPNRPCSMAVIQYRIADYAGERA